MKQSRYAAMQAIGGIQDRFMVCFVHPDIMKISLLITVLQVQLVVIHTGMAYGHLVFY
jgi:hypothetical protein